MNPIPKCYQKLIEQYPLLSVEQERELGKQIQGKNKKLAEEAVEILTLSNIRFAIKTVMHEYNYYSDLEDLMSAATLGLHHAAKRFNTEAGTRFITYARWWIKHFITKQIENSQTIRLSRHSLSILQKIQNLSAQFEEEYGFTPTADEISEALGMKCERIEQYLSYKYHMSPLDATSNFKESNFTLADTIEDKNAVKPDRAMEIKHDSKTVLKLMNCLNEREKTIITKRYGLDGSEPQILEEIGKALKITRERVRQLQNQAEKKMKMCFAKEPLPV